MTDNNVGKFVKVLYVYERGKKEEKKRKNGALFCFVFLRGDQWRRVVRFTQRPIGPERGLGAGARGAMFRKVVTGMTTNTEQRH